MRGAYTAGVEAVVGFAVRGGQRAGAVIHLANEPIAPDLWNTDNLAA